LCADIGEAKRGKVTVNGALHTYVALNKPEDWIHRIDFSDPATALAHVAEEFDGWAPDMKRICFLAARPLLQRRTGTSSSASTTMRLKVCST
jgi:hypothetical protein